MNFYAFQAAKCYNTGGIDRLDFAFCVLKLLLKMLSRDFGECQQSDKNFSEQSSNWTF